MSETPEVGQVFVVDYPFVHRMNTVPDETRNSAGIDYFATKEERDTEFPWKPGHEHRGQDEHGRDYTDADGLGKMELTVISVHKPGKFPTRVFYTRRFTDPDGRIFGKGTLHISTLGKFRRISMRYQVEFEIRKRIPLAARPVEE